MLDAVGNVVPMEVYTTDMAVSKAVATQDGQFIPSRHSDMYSVVPRDVPAADGSGKLYEACEVVPRPPKDCCVVVGLPPVGLDDRDDKIDFVTASVVLEID